jgi:hypothetical protein
MDFSMDFSRQAMDLGFGTTGMALDDYPFALRFVRREF